MPVVFNGNGYSAAWPEEAARRGLHNRANTVEVLEHYSDPAVMDVFLGQHVLTERELLARQDILLESYIKTIEVEARILADMARSTILPLGLHAQKQTADLVLATRAICDDNAEVEMSLFTKLRTEVTGLSNTINTLENATSSVPTNSTLLEMARYVRDVILPAMAACRSHCDALERILDNRTWPLPSYAEMMWMH